MTIPFSKYQGTGNDFIIIDNRNLFFAKNDTKLIKKYCDLRFGIGADGLILLENHETLDFEMVYYNADGRPSSMCGNGGRCIVAFAKSLGIIQDTTTFMAVDGAHEAKIEGDTIHLKMADVNEIIKAEDYVFLDTGSPHHVAFVPDLEGLDVKAAGSAIRYSGLYGEAGSNINFIKAENGGFAVRTYERGVEDETLSCGTGVTAVALAVHHMGETDKSMVDLHVQGGRLQVRFVKTEKGYGDIYLIGPATFVFSGIWPK